VKDSDNKEIIIGVLKVCLQVVKKDTEKMKTLRRKGMEAYQNEEQLCMGS